MTRSFKRHGSHIRMQLHPAEVDLLVELRDGLRSALERDDPDDPVVRRLFPRAVVGDEDADADLRSLLHDSLLEERLAGLEEVTALLERGSTHHGLLRVDLAEDEPLVVLGVLNDLRLAIGAQVGIEDLDRTAVSDDDPVAYRLAIMDHLAWLQEQLLAVLDPPSVSVHDDLGPEDLT